MVFYQKDIHICFEHSGIKRIDKNITLVNIQKELNVGQVITSVSDDYDQCAHKIIL